MRFLCGEFCSKTILNFKDHLVFVRSPAVIFLLLPFGLFAQSGFYSIDSKVESIPFAKTDTLAKQLAALGNTDREKVRAIFRWITGHIDYNVRTIGKNRNTPPLFYEEPDDSGVALPPLNERIAQKVLYKGVAFCDGYSRLFKTLCDHAGIKAEVIYGYARTNNNRRFAVNHTWNAVYIDSVWQLLDVTWASGVVSFTNEYIREYNDYYFLTPPGQFIRDHYPEDPQWTLLNNPPVYREYAQSPFRYSGYIKSGITNYFPLKGVIDITASDTILIELKAKREIRNFYVSESPEFDSTQAVSIYPNFNSEGFSFKYNIASPVSEWLYIFCNDEPVLRYKLNVKKDAAINNRQNK